MKLRIRFRGRRELIELSNTHEIILSDVKRAVCQQLSLSDNSFQLSLDGKTLLPTENGSTLRDLGIVGGDLLHVLFNEATTSGTSFASAAERGATKNKTQDGNQELLEQLLQMGFAKESALRALHTTKAISLNEALDILSREQISTSNAPSTSKEPCHLHEAMDTEKSNTNENPTVNKKQMDKKEMAEAHGDDDRSKDTKYHPNVTYQPSREDTQKLRKIEYTPKALLCRDGIPYLLQMCYEQALITTLHEAVCIAIHVLMLETGFVNHITQESVDKHPQSDEGPSTSTKEDTIIPSYTPVVPDNWRTNCGAKFVYVHPACPRLTCRLVCTSLGPYVLAHGMSTSPSCSEVHQCRLSAADFVKGNVDLRANSAADVYRNLQRLSLSVKDQIAYPLLSSMRHELNLEEIYGFMALPAEVKLMVLCLLPVKCILNMSVTCRELHALADDHTLWQHLCFRDFGLLTKGKYSSWKTEYGRHHKDVIEKERNRQILSQAQRYYDQPGIYNPYAPFTPPGILGGRHDLFPSVPYMPGGIQPVPGSIPRPGNLPRPRFDPFGPAPDMDIIPGSRRYPPGRGRGRGGFPPGPFF
ncbi:F-box only protein 7-like isoform X2 [Actinia tenebrosa]|uniref:F-box only protein 7-like isoform X2 n=1 Tax=Actinia tenebrosa TaxID=6105 RepID=A0A6P8HT71_ACTTE|nr:F-box only protein 7-like isoform X2 [Actinia tenebrosa]